MNVSSECEAILALPVVAPFRRCQGTAELIRQDNGHSASE
jgi:hypothetical protein